MFGLHDRLPKRHGLRKVAPARRTVRDCAHAREIKLYA